MKKFKYGILMLCFMFMISGCTKQQEINTPTSTTTPLLLEVTKEGMDQKLYLFGSIHAGEETLYPLPDYVMDAYKESEVIAVEFDVVEYEKDLDGQIELLSRFVNLDGIEIKDQIGEESYNKGVEILKSAHLYNSLFDRYNPIMWQMLLENAVIMDVDLDEKYGIDKHFIKLSKEDQKEILELESAEIQYNILSSFDYDTQKYLLENALEEYEEAKENMKKLYELYKKGNKEGLEELVFEEEDEPNQYWQEYNDKFITERNKNMTNSLETAFQEGKNIFCTVGLAHIIGEGGIADLLEQQGYSVSVVR